MNQSINGQVKIIQLSHVVCNGGAAFIPGWECLKLQVTYTTESDGGDKGVYRPASEKVTGGEQKMKLMGPIRTHFRSFHDKSDDLKQFSHDRRLGYCSLFV